MMLSDELQIEKNIPTLLDMVDQISKIVDQERNALGFWPKPSLVDAIHRGRLWVVTKNKELLGFLIYSGVSPYAKIQAIGTVKTARNQKVASFLMKSFISEMEKLHFISIKAEIASDLENSIKFYRSHGFKFILEKSGGLTTKRKILVHARELETDTLFTKAEASDNNFTFEIPKNTNQNKSRVHVLDLNVLLDLAKGRPSKPLADKLFNAVLSHKLRVAVANEFIHELRRNSSNAPKNDIVLQMALNLPKLPNVEVDQLKQLAKNTHQIIFSKESDKIQNSPQAHSDSTHVSHAILANAFAFVTRDKTILLASEELRKQYKIEIIDLNDLVELLPENIEKISAELNTLGVGFYVKGISNNEVKAYLTKHDVNDFILKDYHLNQNDTDEVIQLGVYSSNKLVAIGAMALPFGVEDTARMIIHADSDNVHCEFYADYLINTLVTSASEKKSVSIALVCIAGQSFAHSIAKSKGFIKSSVPNTLEKIALGTPVTSNNWNKISTELRRKIGLELPAHIPEEYSSDLTISNYQGVSTTFSVSDLENLFSPAIIIPKQHSGVIVPIQKKYADDLLGTSDQLFMDFIEAKRVSFMTIRSYVNSPRSAKIMKPERAMLFYESSSEGGRKAVVAIARIVDAVVTTKDLSENMIERLAVDKVHDFSKSDEVLLTTFDNLIKFPTSVSLQSLREIGADNGANFVSPVKINSKQVSQIIDKGWCNA